jgi:hypothetical protein
MSTRDAVTPSSVGGAAAAGSSPRAPVTPVPTASDANVDAEMSAQRLKDTVMVERVSDVIT